MNDRRHQFFVVLMVMTASMAAAQPTLHYVGTVSQYGPVAFRDPLGILSPDGRWLAYGVGREVKARRLEGGPVHELGTIESQVRELAWLPDSGHVAVRESAAGELRWWTYDVTTAERQALWAGRRVRGAPEGGAGGSVEIDSGRLSELAWSRDGKSAAGVVRGSSGSELWIVDIESGEARVRKSPARLSFPAFTPDGKDVACLSFTGGRQRADLRCGQSDWAGSDEAYGPIAFSPDGSRLYYASPNERGFLDLWSRTLGRAETVQLTRYGRDTYAPTVARDGRVLFLQQRYHTSLAAAPADGGASTALTTFQSETPFWSPNGAQIGFTYGTWRRIVDDFRYPDISQHLGIIEVDRAPAEEPQVRVRASGSEDQSLCWSPNGKWIALHSHYGPSDDVWLQPADGSAPARQITEGGYETGWPRWSPDGGWILYTSFRPDRSRGAIYLIGVDQETGEITQEQREVPLDGYSHDAVMAEWTPDGEHIVFESAGPPGTKELYRLPREGGRPVKLHEWKSEQVYSGLSVSPDGRSIAYVGPAPDGFYQIFALPMEGGSPAQLTRDPTHKTQPAYSPRGDRIAFTVWTYESQFWVMAPAE